MHENEIAKEVINICFLIHKKTGPGLYENILSYELTKQLLSYLKLTNIKLGLLINFGMPLLKDGIIRIINVTL